MLFHSIADQKLALKRDDYEIGSNATEKNDRESFATIIEKWKSPTDAYTYAKSIDITAEELRNSWSLANDKPGLYRAIKLHFGGWANFKKWLGTESAPNFEKLVLSWRKPIDVIKFIESIGISKEQLFNSEFLHSAKITTKDGGTTYGLQPLYFALKARFKGWDKFKIWMGEQDFRRIVNSWKKPKDALNYAKSIDLPESTLILSSLLKQTEVTKQKTGEVLQLSGLYVAIKERFKEWSDFRIWMGHNRIGRGSKNVGVPAPQPTHMGKKDTEKKIRKKVNTFHTEVDMWKKRSDALMFAKLLNISKKQLLNAGYLKTHTRNENGNEIKLIRLYEAIRYRFREWKNFQKWMGIKPPPDFRQIVKDWKSPEDAQTYARSIGLNTDDLVNSTKLNKLRLSSKDNLVSYSLQSLYRAIVEKFDGWPNFQTWMGVERRDLKDKFLDELFATKDARQLESLASQLGDAALAEYLCAKYQGRFRYNSSFVENLRRYLGEIEVPAAGGAENIPVGIISITELNHLRQALFNHYRDKYQPTYTKGLKFVEKELNQSLKRAKEKEQKEFIRSLLTYFRKVDAIKHPRRLKQQIAGHGEYPAKHQKIAMHEICDKKSVLLADEMGGGKTGSAIAGFESLREKRKAKRALILCPAQVMDVWKKALSDNPDGYFEKGKAPNVVFLENGGKDWHKAKNADYVVISIESSGRGKYGKLRENQIKRLGCDYLVVDEAHNVKNPRGEDTERIFRISQSKSIVNGHLVLLSGTPVPNTVKDVAAQIRLLYSGREKVEGIDITDLKGFAKEIMRGSPLLVRNFLVRRMLRRHTEDCLPVGCEFTREVISTQLSPVERAYYDAIVGSPFYTATEKIEALRRECLHSETKYDLLKASINNALERPKYKKAKLSPKIIVAESSFAKGITRDHNDTRKVEKSGEETYFASRILNDMSGTAQVFVLDGKNSNKRDEILEEFRQCKQPAMLFTLVPVIGEGLNLSYASDGILLTPTFTVSDEEQFFRRMLRKGQKEHVHLQILRLADSIEQGILEYAIRKESVVRGLIDGRPLTPQERELLGSNFKTVRDGGVIAYETLSPRQKALWILSRITGKGKDFITEFLASENGKYAKDFAIGYPQDEETSYSGNTARLTAALIDSLKGKKCEIADIACGCRTLERMYEGTADVSVQSTDINEAALDAGSKLLKRKSRVKLNEVKAMDDLPYKDKSKDIAVLSLALEFTRHNSTKGHIGSERVRTLKELNRILKTGGIGILNFQEKLFKDAASFRTFCKAIEREFGFEIIKGKTGLAASLDEKGTDKFRVWTVSLKKVGEPNEVFASPESWMELRFKRMTKQSSGTKNKTLRRQPVEKVGAYHDTFSISNSELSFKPTTPSQKEIKLEQKQAEAEYHRLEKRLSNLVKSFGSLDNIPENLLLSISLSDIRSAAQHERDKYFALLIKLYGGVKKVPIDKISKESDVILIRGESRRGPYLCLARIDGSGKKPCGFGKRYFFAEDIK